MKDPQFYIDILERHEELVVGCEKNLHNGGWMEWYDHIIKFENYFNLQKYGISHPTKDGRIIKLKGKVLIISQYELKQIQGSEPVRYYIIPKEFRVENP